MVAPKAAESYACSKGESYLAVQADIGNHSAALNHVLQYIRDAYSQNIEREVQAVGHRVVHGKNYSSAQLVTPQVEAAIKDAAVFAP